MIEGKKTLAYIPARSGSKSVPHKNIADLNGKPVIAYTINAAKQSKYVDKVIVSTDSEEYAKIAREYGAEAPFLRPVELSGDRAREIDAALHLIEWLEGRGEQFDYILKLQATSPLRLAEDVDAAIEKLHEKKANCVISVSEAQVHPWWMNTLDDEMKMDSFLREEAYKNRQELPTFYQLNGLVFAATWNHIKEAKSWYGTNSYAIITPNSRSVDIDNPTDLEMARILLRQG